MKINSTENEHDSLYHDTLTMVGISDTSQYPIKQFIRNANVWYRKGSIWINEAVGTWSWDDSNWTTLMATTTTLTAGTQYYDLPSGTRKIDRMEILDSDSNYQILEPFDKSQIKSVAMSELMETDGLPTHYDLEGNQVFLYPAPAEGYVTTAAGLKWHVIRDISPFGIADTSTEPGFDNHFHRVVSYGAAYDFCVSNGIDDRKKGIRDELEILHKEINEHYGSRHRDMLPRIVPTDHDGI